jgi:hypothetical protein
VNAAEWIVDVKRGGALLAVSAVLCIAAARADACPSTTSSRPNISFSQANVQVSSQRQNQIAYVNTSGGAGGAGGSANGGNGTGGNGGDANGGSGGSANGGTATTGSANGGTGGTGGTGGLGGNGGPGTGGPGGLAGTGGNGGNGGNSDIRFDRQTQFNVQLASNRIRIH